MDNLNAVQRLKQHLNQLNYDLYNIVQEANRKKTNSNYKFEYDRYRITVELTERNDDCTYYCITVYPKPWPDMGVHNGLSIPDNWTKGQEWKEVADRVQYLILTLIRFGY